MAEEKTGVTIGSEEITFHFPDNLNEVVNIHDLDANGKLQWAIFMQLSELVRINVATLNFMNQARQRAEQQVTEMADPSKMVVDLLKTLQANGMMPTLKN